MSKNNSGQRRASGNGSNKVRRWFGPPMLFLSLTFAVPIDIVTTARWYEEAGWRIVFNDSGGFLAPLNDWLMTKGFSFSAEALAFSLMIFLLQVALTYIFIETPWFEEGQGDVNATFIDVWRKKIRRMDTKGLSPGKMWSGIFLIIVVLFDSSTAFEYRMVGTAGWLKTLILVILFDNVLSEWMLTLGAGYTIDIVSDTWSGLSDWLSGKVKVAIPKGMSPQQQQAKPQQQQAKPQQQQQNSNRSKQRSNVTIVDGPPTQQSRPREMQPPPPPPTSLQDIMSQFRDE